MTTAPGRYTDRVTPTSTSSRGSAHTGQSVVELAITLPILLLLILGLVNLGILMQAQIVLTNAAWEGARAGATITDPAHGDEEIIGAVQRSLSGLDASRVTIDIDPEQDEPPRDKPGPLPRGQPLAVSLEYRLTMSLPVSVEVPVRARAVSRMEYRNP
ncbi:MAG: pilus assembly protein [Anaerolineales bacterium]|nr:pilus assembly protein [Anaerolineales bacterium]